MATGSRCQTVTNGNVLGTSLNRYSIVTVEDGEAVNQDVSCSTGRIISHRTASFHHRNSRNIETVGVEGEAAGRFGVKDGVLDGVVVTVQSHVPKREALHTGSGTSTRLDCVKLTMRWACWPCNQ